MPDLDYRDDEPLFCGPEQEPNMSVLPPAEPNMSLPPEPNMSVAPGPNMSVDPSAHTDAFGHMCEAPVTEATVAPPAPRLGLDSYDVVPDDFVGPLGPNQIRQSQRADLDKYKFGDFNVVADDFEGPLPLDQMRQSEYQAMQQAWLNISNGQGMSINGSAADQETFRNMLRSGMTDSPTFRNMISGIGNDADPAHRIQANVGRSQPGVIGDSFATNDVDLDDLEVWPGAAPTAHPNQVSRNELMVHFLTERQNALSSSNPADFAPAHQHGIDMQNQYRTERGQRRCCRRPALSTPMGRSRQPSRWMAESARPGISTTTRRSPMSRLRELSRCALLLSLAISVAACEQAPEPRPAALPQPKPAPAVMPANEPVRDKPMDKNLESSFANAELVIVARPTRLQPSPKIWSGTLATFQSVDYEVSRVFKGRGIEPGQPLTVQHPLVAKSKTASSDQAELLPSAFDSHKTYVVFLRSEKSAFYCTSENDGIVEATADVVEQVERLGSK